MSQTLPKITRSVQHQTRDVQDVLTVMGKFREMYTNGYHNDHKTTFT